MGHSLGTDVGIARFHCKGLRNLCRRTTARRFGILTSCARLGCTCGSRCLRVRLCLQYIGAYGVLMGVRTDVRNRQAFAQKLKVIADELRQRMAGIRFTPKSSPCTEYLPDKL